MFTKNVYDTITTTKNQMGVFMYKAYRFRIYPNNDQKVLIHKTFGCTRFIYNYFLDVCKKEKFKSAYEMCATLKEMYEAYSWLKEVDSCALRCAIFNLEDAYKDFFAKRSDYPVFKSKYARQSYRTNCIRSSYKGNEYSNISIDLKKKEIKLPKLGTIKIAGYRNLKEWNQKIINATVLKETTGKYYISVVVEEQKEEKMKVKPNSIVGIDVGIKNHVITSNGEIFENPKYLEKREKQLKRLQRKLARQRKGSSNYQKTKKRIAIMHSKIKNSRKHHIINIANQLVKENDIIVSEKLNVKGMIKNHRLSKK